jgi:hypothetical protein
MVTIHRRFALALSLLGMAACAPRPSATPSASGPVRWSGSFKQMQMPTAEVGPATPNRGYGSITLTPARDRPGRMHVELSINAPVPAGTQVAWAVFTGTCGSPSPMVTGENQFPTIEVAGNGSGLVRTEMPLELDPRGSYHANVYWSSRARGLNEVLMCANLSLDTR